MAGYSGAPLSKKLGIGAGSRCLLIGAPEAVAAEIAGAGASILPSPAPGGVDVIVWFLRERAVLEEAVRICLQMWSGEVGTFEGQHYRLAETLNSPPAVSQPHPPILIGGGGEKKTLRLVAQYGDACNVRADSPEFIRQKFAVLREHCDRLGRDYDAIEKTVITRIDVGADGEQAEAEAERLAGYAEAGAQTAIGYLVGCETFTPFDAVPKTILPAIRGL